MIFKGHEPAALTTTSAGPHRYAVGPAIRDVRALMKIAIILAAILLALGGLALLARTRLAKEHKASARQIPLLIERLKAGQGSPRFAVLVFVPTNSQDGESVNLQYSIENGTPGFDWVLIGPRNIADKGLIIEAAARCSAPLTEHEMNGVRYLRYEGPRAAELGMNILQKVYGIDPSIQLDLVAEGFEW